VTNTTSEIPVYCLSIPANTLGTTNGLRVRLSGTFNSNSGTAAQRAFTVGVRIGVASCTVGSNITGAGANTLLYQDTTPQFAQGTTSRAVFFDVQLFNAGSASSQKLGGRFSISSPNGAATGVGRLGIFNSSQADAIDSPIYGTASKDTTAAQIFTITITPTGAASTFNFTKTMVVTEELQ